MEIFSPKEKRKPYASTLPASKETVNLVKIYCVINNIPVHQFINTRITEELAEFKEKINNFRQLKTGEI